LRKFSPQQNIKNELKVVGEKPEFSKLFGIIKREEGEVCAGKA
jgi:hypothetical protein